MSDVSCDVADEFFFWNFCFDYTNVESFVVSVVAEFLENLNVGDGFRKVFGDGV